MTQDEMVGWHHRLDGHEFEKAPGVGDGQGGLGVLTSMGSQSVGHDCASEISNTQNSIFIQRPSSINFKNQKLGNAP